MADEKQPVQDTRPDVIEVDPSMRADLVLAFLKRRAARAELGEANAKVDTLVASLDKDGSLRKAVAEASALMNVFNMADAALNGLIAKVQQKAGFDLLGYQLDPETGNIKKSPPPMQPCKGKNCGATDGRSHSAECRAEYEAATRPVRAKRKKKK